MVAEESVSVSEALRAPKADGVKVTLTVQLVPAESVVPQLVVEIAKSLALVPEIAIFAGVAVARVAVPVFCKVEDWAALVVPVFWLPKVTTVGLQLIVGAVTVTPVPLRATVMPAFVSFKVAVRAPAAVGLKVTLTVQERPAARVDPQVVVLEKSPLFVPVKVRFTLTVDPVPFISVVFWLALELPTF